MRVSYPFIPKSTSHLRRGQYWSVPLSNHKYACGVVLHLLRKNDGKIDGRLFHAGLLDWVGELPPTVNDIENCHVLKSNAAHIKSIKETGGAILGEHTLAETEPEIIDFTDDIDVWGYRFIAILGDKYLGAGS